MFIPKKTGIQGSAQKKKRGKNTSDMNKVSEPSAFSHKLDPQKDNEQKMVNSKSIEGSANNLVEVKKDSVSQDDDESGGFLVKNMKPLSRPLSPEGKSKGFTDMSKLDGSNSDHTNPLSLPLHTLSKQPVTGIYNYKIGTDLKGNETASNLAASENMQADLGSTLSEAERIRRRLYIVRTQNASQPHLRAAKAPYPETQTRPRYFL